MLSYLEANWRCMVTSTPGRFITEKETHCPLFSKLDAPYSRFERGGEEKNSAFCV